MKSICRIILLSLIIFPSCTSGQEPIINEQGNTIIKRFNTPVGYTRTNVSSESFEFYLRNLTLKPYGSKVKYYNGIIKPNFWVSESVINMDVGDKNLQQCADAIMRLRGEYLYSKQKFEEIHFNFTNGFRVDYSEWIKGNRIKLDGNKSYWVKQTSPSNTYKDFRKYMDIIFAYAGTLSLEKELVSVNISDIQIGDVFIQGGSPGHAVIVVDLAENDKGEQVFMLAQSYMPAQDIHILKNPNDKEISPWYNVNFEGDLITPEWTFKKTDLKRFRN